MGEIDYELLPIAAELGTVVVAHSPTSHGLLHQAPRTPEKRPNGLPSALVEIASTHDATAGQVALA